MFKLGQNRARHAQKERYKFETRVMPSQGAKECARRLKQRAKGQLNFSGSMQCKAYKFANTQMVIPKVDWDLTL